MAEKQPDDAQVAEREEQRAIRRATEAVRHIGRPADWSGMDYVRFKRVLDESGFALVRKETD